MSVLLTHLFSLFFLSYELHFDSFIINEHDNDDNDNDFVIQNILCFVRNALLER